MSILKRRLKFCNIVHEILSHFLQILAKVTAKNKESLHRFGIIYLNKLGLRSYLINFRLINTSHFNLILR